VGILLAHLETNYSYMKIFLHNFLSVFFALSLLSTSLMAQPVLLTKNIKAERITPNGFTLQWENTGAQGYAISLTPVNNPNAEGLSFIEIFERSKQEVNFTFSEGLPATIYEMQLKIFDQSPDTVFYSKFYSTQSRSGGAIRAMFNHPVDHSYTDIEDAVSVGDKLRDSLIAFIGRIENTMDIAIYNSFGNNANTLISGAINEAYNRGVQIRIVHNGSTNNSMLDFINVNIPTIASPEPSLFGYGLMHHKFVIADADHDDPEKAFVWTGSTNWTTSQIVGPDRNNVMIVQDQALAQTFKIEFEEMWGGSSQLPNENNSRFGPDKLDNTPKEFMVGSIPVECYFSPSDGTQQVIVDAINGAQHNLTIATMLITRWEFSTAIVNRFNAGITTTSVLLDTQNPSGSQKPYLQSNLPPENMREFGGSGQMHHKMMIADHGEESVVLVNGSHNWSNAAELRNDENTLLVFDQNIANQYYQGIGWMLNQSGGTLGVIDLNFSDKISLFPNPAKEFCYLNTNVQKESQIKIFDLQGKLVYQRQVVQGDFGSPIKLNISQLKAGFYLVRLENEDGLSTQKLIVE
jgi:phosphatidylserine/phosphatidylglycerophosphate/cardiolipin synthase-like enzyme